MKSHITIHIKTMFLLDTNCTDHNLYMKNPFYHTQYEMLKNAAENNTYKTKIGKTPTAAIIHNHSPAVLISW